jgi:hypothetical protein
VVEQQIGVGGCKNRVVREAGTAQQGSSSTGLLKRHAESFCRKPRQQGGVTAVSIALRCAAARPAHGPHMASGPRPCDVCGPVGWPGWRTVQPTGPGQPSRGQCGGATARRATAAARVADLTQHDLEVTSQWEWVAIWVHHIEFYR